MHAIWELIADWFSALGAAQTNARRVRELRDRVQQLEAQLYSRPPDLFHERATRLPKGWQDKLVNRLLDDYSQVFQDALMPVVWALAGELRRSTASYARLHDPAQAFSQPSVYSVEYRLPEARGRLRVVGADIEQVA